MPEITPSRWMEQAGWDDVPHIDEETKAELLRSTPPHLRDARSKGTPSLGSGAIFPVEESFIKVEPFPIPKHWKRVYALDVGWRKTAAIWGAIDPETDTLYLFAEYYRGEAHPSTHASAIRARGEWIPGVFDPAARNRTPLDGTKLLDIYVDNGLDLTPANNAVEAGILEVLERMQTGRLKVFATCVNWFAEWRLYRRDEKGRIVKEFDHLMDTTRYLVMSGLGIARTKPVAGPMDFTPSQRGSTRCGY